MPARMASTNACNVIGVLDAFKAVCKATRKGAATPTSVVPTSRCRSLVASLTRCEDSA
jgi:hypothetical protein